MVIFIVGAAVIATFSVTVVMGQEYLPGRIGVASGVTLGLSIGLGGLGAPLLGVVADAWGLTTTLYVIAALPLVALAMIGTLPPPAGGRPSPAWPSARDVGHWHDHQDQHRRAQHHSEDRHGRQEALIQLLEVARITASWTARSRMKA